MTHKNIFNRILGLIMSQNHSDQKAIFSNINRNWFRTTFHISLYDSMDHLLRNNEYIDMLNVHKWLRENDQIEDETISKIAGLQSDVQVTDMMNINGIINECYFQYSIREVSLKVQGMSNELLSISPSSGRIMELLNDAREVLTINTASNKVDNDVTIDNVLQRHDQAKDGNIIGLELGWKSLHRKILLEDVDVMVVGGRPAMGKTAWALSMIKNLVFDQDKQIVFFSLEMSKEQIIRRMLALLLEIDSNRIKYGECTHDELETIYNFRTDYRWKNLHILDGSHSIQDLNRELSRLSGQNKIDCYIVDYLQKIIPKKDNNRYQEVTKISNGIKQLTMALRIPAICLAQLSRDSSKTGKRPSLPDLKESGEIEQDASIVAFLHRPEYYGDMADDQGNSTENMGEFIIAKNREGVIGITEMGVKLEYSKWSDRGEIYDQIWEQT